MVTLSELPTIDEIIELLTRDNPVMTYSLAREIRTALESRVVAPKPDDSAIRAAKREVLQEARAQLRAMKYYENCGAIQYVDSLIAALGPPCEHSDCMEYRDPGGFLCRYICKACGMVRERGWTSNWEKAGGDE